MSKKSNERTKYIALVGLNYPSIDDGKERRVEEGDIFDDMRPTSVKHEVAAGNVKPLDDISVNETDPEGSE